MNDVAKALKIAQDLHGYRDPRSLKMKGFRWRPLSDVHKDLGYIAEIPEHVKAFGRYMDGLANKAATSGLSARDLIKSYVITRGSMRRNARSADNLRKAGLVLPDEVTGQVRPEGAIGHWLMGPMGQAYLHNAERGIVHPEAVEHAAMVMKPFGLDTERQSLPWAAQNLPGREADVSRIVAQARDAKMNPEDWAKFIEKTYGVSDAKSGFLGSLLGKGDRPTLDARQIVLHTGRPVAENTNALARAGNDAVQRLAARQKAMNLALPSDLSPYYQHLAHHAVWDKAAGETTTHQDVMNAMQTASRGGAVDKAVRIARAEGGGVHPHRPHKPHRVHVGPLHTHVAGRTDHLPTHVPHNSYVLPADIVSALGEGNTLSGFNVVRRQFDGLPYSGSPNPYGQHGGPYLVGKAQGGSLTAGAPPVPVVLAGGEYVLEPEEVERAGDGDVAIGHRVLDDFVKQYRAKTIKTLSGLPGPRRD